MDSAPEVYPMPLFVRLAVSDVEASTAWYEALGFETVYSMPVMAHVRYRKYADVMLATEQAAGSGMSSPSSRGSGVSIYLTVEGESVDDVASRAEASGADVVEGPHETSWNTREFTVADPDGYELVFSEVVDPDRRFEDVMGDWED